MFKRALDDPTGTGGVWFKLQNSRNNLNSGLDFASIEYESA
jgi:hypothetical protein